MTEMILFHKWHFTFRFHARDLWIFVFVLVLVLRLWNLLHLRLRLRGRFTFCFHLKCAIKCVTAGVESTVIAIRNFCDSMNSRTLTLNLSSTSLKIFFTLLLPFVQFRCAIAIGKIQELESHLIILGAKEC